MLSSVSNTAGSAVVEVSSIVEHCRAACATGKLRQDKGNPLEVEMSSRREESEERETRCPYEFSALSPPLSPSPPTSTFDSSTARQPAITAGQWVEARARHAVLVLAVMGRPPSGSG